MHVFLEASLIRSYWFCIKTYVHSILCATVQHRFLTASVFLFPQAGIILMIPINVYSSAPDRRHHAFSDMIISLFHHCSNRTICSAEHKPGYTVTGVCMCVCVVQVNLALWGQMFPQRWQYSNIREGGCKNPESFLRARLRIREKSIEFAQLIKQK